MARSPNAIPLSIDLILSDTTSTVPATLLLERLTQLQAQVEIDRDRGRALRVRFSRALLVSGA